MGDATGTTSFPGFQRCVEFLRSPDQAVSEDGYFWLTSRGNEFVEDLIRLLVVELDPEMRISLIELLGETGDSRTLPALQEELNNGSDEVVWWALLTLYHFPSERGKAIADAFRASNPRWSGPL